MYMLCLDDIMWLVNLMREVNSLQNHASMTKSLWACY